MITEIVQAITNAFTSFLSSLSSGILDTATTLFTTSDGKLTTLATIVLVFGGISIAFAIVKWVLQLVKLR